MQLPGMATDPVRITTDFTWWPEEDVYGVSLRLWLQDHRNGEWVLQEMRTSGTPLRHDQATTEWRKAYDRARAHMESLRSLHDFPPFP